MQSNSHQSQIFTPKPDEIKAVVVADFNGRAQTYSSLLSALAAVHQLSQAEMKSIEATIEGVQEIEGD